MIQCLDNQFECPDILVRSHSNHHHMISTYLHRSGRERERERQRVQFRLLCSRLVKGKYLHESNFAFVAVLLNETTTAFYSAFSM